MKIYYCIFLILFMSVNLVAEGLISRSSLQRLEKSIKELEVEESSSAKRRGLKKSVRQAELLLKKYPDAENRFLVLGYYLNIQEALFEMQPTRALQSDILKTAEKLLKAPSKYIQQRLDADAMLTQLKLLELSEQANQAALTLALFADRYRNSKAEARSLMMAAHLAKELGNEPLLMEFRKNLSSRFSHMASVNSFLVETFNVRKPLIIHKELEVYKGPKISFPPVVTSILCFWSKETPELKTRTESIKELQKLYPELKVYSFNLDELRDSGQRTLKAMELNWIPIVMENGVDNELFRRFNQTNDFCIAVIDTNGEVKVDGTVTKTIPGHLHWRVPLKEIYETSLDCPRRQSLRQSLFSGDFVVRSLMHVKNSDLPKETLEGVSKVLAPHNQFNRLSLEEKLKQYKKVDELCQEAIAKYASAKDLWRLWNARVITSIASWKHSGETKYLYTAADYAEKYIKENSPIEAKLINEFCLANLKILEGKEAPTKIIEAFLNQFSKQETSVQSIAFSLILTAQINSIDQFRMYRNQLLETYGEDEKIRSLVAYLYENGSAKSILKNPNLSKVEITDFKRIKRSLVTTPLKAMDGSEVSFVEADQSKIKVMLFIEKDSFEREDKMFHKMVDSIRYFKKRFMDDMQIIFVFRNMERKEIEEFLKRKRWNYKNVNLTDLQWNLLAEKLGLVATDLRPNVALLKGNGEVIQVLSGLDRDSDKSSVRRGPFGDVYNATVSLDRHLRQLDQILAEDALIREDYRELVKRWSLLIPPKYKVYPRFQSYDADAARHYRKIAWCYMKLGELNKALSTINKVHTFRNIKNHRADRHNSQYLFKDRLENDLMLRAKIYKKMKKNREVNRDIQQAKKFTHPHEAREYDFLAAREYCKFRRKQARKLIEKGECQNALELIAKNISIHEAEPERCKTSCRICIEQHDAMQYYAKELKDLGKAKESEYAQAMVAFLQCPSSRKQVRVRGFPVGRLSEAGTGPRRLLYMKTYMLGGGRANKENRDIRLEFANDLWLSYLALKELKQNDKAEIARKRAIALAWPLNPECLGFEDGEVSSYTSLVHVDEDFWNSK